jgi:hypothetical protein
MAGHSEYSVLQGWSVGEIYPWSVVVIADNDGGVCRAQNLITGEVAAETLFGWNNEGSFESAHNYCEAHGRNEKLFAGQLDSESV